MTTQFFKNHAREPESSETPLSALICYLEEAAALHHQQMHDEYPTPRHQGERNAPGLSPQQSAILQRYLFPLVTPARGARFTYSSPIKNNPYSIDAQGHVKMTINTELDQHFSLASRPGILLRKHLLLLAIHQKAMGLTDLKYTPKNIISILETVGKEAITQSVLGTKTGLKSAALSPIANILATFHQLIEKIKWSLYRQQVAPVLPAPQNDITAARGLNELHRRISTLHGTVKK